MLKYRENVALLREAVLFARLVIIGSPSESIGKVSDDKSSAGFSWHALFVV